jgi:hypothetical protein
MKMQYVFDEIGTQFLNGWMNFTVQRVKQLCAITLNSGSQGLWQIVDYLNNRESDIWSCNK